MSKKPLAPDFFSDSEPPQDEPPASGIASHSPWESSDASPRSTILPADRPASSDLPQVKTVPTASSSHLRLRDLFDDDVDALPLATSQATASRRIVDTLMAAGIDTFFGVPGGPISPLFDAVRSTPGAHMIESRHESHAAFAAMGYHRTTRKVAAVLVTAGPGATNVVTGASAAFAERVPMLVICGDVAWAASGGRLLQDSGPEGIAVEQMLAKVMRATVRASRPESAATQALAALHAATSPVSPGPALFVLPMDIARKAAPDADPPHSDRFSEVPAPPSSVLKAAMWLAEAERPLIIVGAGARKYAAPLEKVLDALEVPFMTTPQAKGVVSEEHPFSLRHGGLAASWWTRRYTQMRPDVTLAIGTDLDDCATGPTPPISGGRGGRLIHVDLDATVFHRNFKVDLPILADVGCFLRQLYDLVVARGIKSSRGAKIAQELRASSPFDAPDFREDSSPIIAPHRAIADLERAAKGARFVTDIGEHMLFALHYLTSTGPDMFTIHLGLGSMASGIASAIGQAIGDPNRLVVCICGDGGMQMAGMEMLVAARQRLRIVYAVFNDARYNMVYHGMKQLYGEGAGWETPWVDFVMWARSFGVAGARIERPGQITAELLAELTQDGPAVLDVRIDRERRIHGAGRVESLSHMSLGSKEV